MTEIWDLLRSPADSATMNMALDEALLLTATKRGRPLLRAYSWKEPSVSFGYFQKFPAHLAGKYHVVRRPTGGGLVYHGDGVDTTYTVIAPPGHGLHTMKAADAYCTLHKAVAAAVGSQSQIITRRSLVPRANYECFQNPVAGDVMANGRKLAGGAQRRNKSGMLHQGSIASQVDVDQLMAGFHTELGACFEPYGLASNERAEASWLAREKYATDAWNRRIC